MRRKDPLQNRLYNSLFPTHDRHLPRSWGAFVQDSLLPEVRQEILAFYGEGSPTDETRYPGLDYSYEPHRRRLRRYDNHKLLFEALDKMDLTIHEIREVCTWDGTWAAQRKYERDTGNVVRDTTGDECVPHIREKLEREQEEREQRLKLRHQQQEFLAAHQARHAGRQSSTRVNPRNQGTDIAEFGEVLRAVESERATEAATMEATRVHVGRHQQSAYDRINQMFRRLRDPWTYPDG